MNINAREFRPTSRASAPVTPARGSTPAPSNGAAPLQAGLDRKASGAGYTEGEPASQLVNHIVGFRVSSLQPCVDSSRDCGVQGLWGHDKHTPRDDVAGASSSHAPPQPLQLHRCAWSPTHKGCHHPGPALHSCLQGTQHF